MEAGSFQLFWAPGPESVGHGPHTWCFCAQLLQSWVSARLHTLLRRGVEVLIWILEYVNIYVAWFRGSTQNTNRKLTFLSSSPEIRLVGMHGCIALRLNLEGLTVS